MIIDRKVLIEAFNLWASKAITDPNSFKKEITESYGEDCTDYLIELIKELRAS